MCFQSFKPSNITTDVLSPVQLDDKIAGWNFSPSAHYSSKYQILSHQLHSYLTDQPILQISE
jgi:hypothetical protein